MCVKRSNAPLSSSSLFACTGFALFLISIIACTDGRSLKQSKPCPRVIGGENAPKGRFPYMCSIRRTHDLEHACGGTLIKKRWVLTAAHCLNSKLENLTDMTRFVHCDIHEKNDDDPEKRYFAKEVYLHGNWESDIEKGYDIALIKLNKEADLPVPRLPIQSDTYPIGGGYSVLGWGVTDREECTIELQIGLDMKIVSKTTCSRHKWVGSITKSMICAGGGLVDTAKGDSGGPFLQLDKPLGYLKDGEPFHDFLAGITSFGISEEKREQVKKPGVYTSVSSFREWIDCVIEGKIPKEDCPIIYIPGSPSLAISRKLSEPPVAPPKPDVSALASIIAGCNDIELMGDDFEDKDALEKMKEATKENDSDTVECILNEGMDPNTIYTANVANFSNDTTSILHLATVHNSLESVKVLVDYEADVDIEDGREQTPLHVAAEQGFLDVAKVLVEGGAKINAKSRRGDSPLHYAAYYGHESLVKFLAKRGADINAKNDNEETPLHIAAAKGFVSIVELLLDNKASKLKTDDSGKTPFDVICGELDRDTECNDETKARLKKLLRID